MGITKTEIFTDEQNSIAAIAKVFGHPARVAIIQSIIKNSSCICGDLVTDIGLAQATISQHLRELKKANIIKGTISGTSVCYCIDEDTWQKNKAIISSFLNEPLTNNNLCC